MDKLKLAGLVVAGGNGFKGEISSECYVVGNVPHSILFKHMAAVVHHGGAGTTATAARAGVPQIIVPHFFDQYYWGNQIFKQGLGSRPVNRKHVTIHSLSKAIQECLSEKSYKEQATNFAKRLSEQDTLSNAIRYIESIVA